MTFNIIPAKPTFGNLKQTMFSSEYLQKKNNKIYSCFHNKKNNSCCNYSLFDKTNLNANLVSKQNLFDVCSLAKVDTSRLSVNCKNPYFSVSKTIPCYQVYRIDTRGELFGNSQCGVNNFTRYMDFTNCHVKHK